jgi:hypothetical protein
MNRRILLAWWALIALLPTTAAAQCNGDLSLCAKRYDEVCYVTTHNAFNHQGPFFFPNQTYPISTQLQDGVRALMLDVYWHNNQATVYHSSNFLGNQPLIDLLDDTKAFLDQHPNEVVTLILESYISAAQTEAVFQQAGLLPYCHVQNAAQPWPTLGDMIQAGTRLVVLTDASDTQGHPWLHHVWDHAVETHFTAYSRADFSCAFNRGDSSNALFILNHFVTQNPLGYGLIDSATAINALPYLQSRAMGCWAATGKLPNFLTVDFYERGEVFAVAAAINAGLVQADVPAYVPAQALQVYPQPCAGTFTLVLPTAPRGACELVVWDGIGRMVYQERRAWQPEIQVRLPDHLQAGRYVVEMRAEARSLRWVISLVK